MTTNYNYVVGDMSVSRESRKRCLWTTLYRGTNGDFCFSTGKHMSTQLNYYENKLAF